MFTEDGIPLLDLLEEAKRCYTASMMTAEAGKSELSKRFQKIADGLVDLARIKNADRQTFHFEGNNLVWDVTPPDPLTANNKETLK